MSKTSFSTTATQFKIGNYGGGRWLMIETDIGPNGGCWFPMMPVEPAQEAFFVSACEQLDVHQEESESAVDSMMDVEFKSPHVDHSYGWTSVDSSTIAEIRYTQHSRGCTGRLLVRFKSDTEYTYSYSNVPWNIAEDFKNAASKGKYLIREIKPNYDCEKI